VTTECSTCTSSRADPRLAGGMVDIAQLVDALAKFVWKRGIVTGPGVKHEVAANGDHVTYRAVALTAFWSYRS
jgi:hypothetical protein